MDHGLRRWQHLEMADSLIQKIMKKQISKISFSFPESKRVKEIGYPSSQWVIQCLYSSTTSLKHIIQLDYSKKNLIFFQKKENDKTFLFAPVQEHVPEVLIKLTIYNLCLARTKPINGYSICPLKTASSWSASSSCSTPLTCRCRRFQRGGQTKRENSY